MNVFVLVFFCVFVFVCVGVFVCVYVDVGGCVCVSVFLVVCSVLLSSVVSLFVCVLGGFAFVYDFCCFFFIYPAPTEIFTILFVGSVRFL